jgi:hypothetical protein
VKRLLLISLFSIASAASVFADVTYTDTITVLRQRSVTVDNDYQPSISDAVANAEWKLNVVWQGMPRWKQAALREEERAWIWRKDSVDLYRRLDLINSRIAYLEAQ